MRTLVIAEHDNADLRAATLHTIQAARAIGKPVDVLVVGSNASAVVTAARGVDGVDTVLIADAPQFLDGLAENVAAQVLSVAPTYGHVFFAATAAGKNVAPRVAAKLDASQISDVIAIEAADTFQRPIYAGNAIATVRSIDPIVVATIRITAFAAAGARADSAAEAPVEAVACVADTAKSRFLRRESAQNDRPDLSAARVVVSGGRGLGSAENFRKLDPLADQLGAAVGASRAAVDSGYASNDLQVGQTGKIVAPELYVAVGISGAIQHLAGMKDAKIIVAINKDADAPIFGVADYGLVADLFDAVPQLTTQLAQRL